MSVADKLLTIANNTPLVCASLGEKKTVSGNPITVGDVSTNEHTLQIKLTSDTVMDFSNIEIIKCGKNLFDVSKIKALDGYYINNGDGTITVLSYGTSTSTFLKELCPSLKAGDTAVLSFVTEGLKMMHITTTKTSWYVGKSLVITEEMLNSVVIFYSKRIDGVNYPTIISNIQIELGNVVTEYEPYKAPQTATANSDGTVEGLMSVSPNMTLISDGDVSIECTYKSGGNIAVNEKFIELQNAFAGAKEVIQSQIGGVQDVMA